MKKSTAIFIVILFFLSLVLITIVENSNAGNWTDNWSVNGISVKKIKEANGKDYVALAAGIGTSFAVHWLGHVAYLESNNIDWHQNGLEEHMDMILTSNQRNNMGRAGFLTQLLVGTAIKFTNLNDTFFGTGYHIGTFVEINSYPLLHGIDVADIGYMRDGREDDGMTEFVGYSVWSMVLMPDWK